MSSSDRPPRRREDSELRLDRYLASAGVASRRHSGELIRGGRVRVDGRTVTEPGFYVSPEEADVRFDGRPVRVSGDHVYIKLHKPPGYLTTMDDPRGRPTVMDLLPEFSRRVFPVGRLDLDSSGLLLLTSDGDWAQGIAHPRYRIPRVYEAWVEGCPDGDVLGDLREGIPLADGEASFDGVSILDRDERSGRARLEVTLSEGRYREVRRMMATVGHPVLSLQRVAVGSVRLGDLPSGEWQYMDEREVASFATS